MENKHEVILRDFASKDMMRQTLLYPQKQDGFYYSSDAHSLVWFEESVAKIETKYIEKAPKYSTVIHLSYSDKIILSAKELYKIFSDKIPIINLQKECENCEGEGVQECNLGEAHECSSCGGSGCYFVIPYVKVLDSSCTILLKDTCFNFGKFKKIIDTILYLGYDEFEWKKTEINKGNVFTSSEINFLLMPIVPDEEGYNQAIKIL